MGVYLSAPVTEKISTDKKCKRFSYGASSMQGWRMTQEDAHNCVPDFDETGTALFAVYDGHGGAEVAQYCAQHLPDYIRSLQEYKEGKLAECLQAAFLGFDETLTREEVIKELKVLAGVDEDDVEDDEDGDPMGRTEADILRAEASMPMDELLAKYEGNPPAGQKTRQLRKAEQFTSPMIRPKRPADGSGDNVPNGEDRNNSSEADSIATRLEDKLINGLADNENNLNAEKELNQSSKISSSDSVHIKCVKSNSSEMEKDSLPDSSDANDTVGAKSDNISSHGALNSDSVSGSANEPSASDTTQQEPSSSSSGLVSEDQGPSSSSSSSSSMSSSKNPSSSSAAVEAGPSSSGAGSSSGTGPSSSGAGSSSSGAGSSGSGPGSSNSGAGSSASGSSGSGSAKEPSSSHVSSSSSDDPGPSGSTMEEEPGSSGSGSRGGGPSVDEDSDEDDDSEDEDEEYMEDSDEEEESEEEEEEVDEDLPVLEDDTRTEDPGADSGCTAVVALLGDQEVVVANAGDSRCVLCRAGKAIDLSFDHKPEDAPEKNRVEAAGGKVTADGRVNGGLNLSRAIGDHVYKNNKDLSAKDQMITAFPDIESASLGDEDEFLVLACDGIWNFMTSQEVVDFVRERLKDEEKRNKLSIICEEMFDHCLAPNTHGDGTGCDNMTCIIVTFDQVVNKQIKRSSTPVDAEDAQPEKKPKLQDPVE